MTSDESAYRGRWVARLDGRIIAHGGTPKQARLQARLIYPKEALPVEYIPLDTPLHLHPALPRLLDALADQPEFYLVGGLIRDALLQRPTHDIDLILPSQAFAVARQLARRLGAAFVPLDPEHDIARIVWKVDEAPLIIDLAAYQGPDLEADLRARDFTINAIAFDPRAQTLLDPLGGQADLRARVLRQCSPQSLPADPLRGLRAIRFAAALGLRIEPATRTAIKQAAPLLSRVAAERIRDEMFNILQGPTVSSALQALYMLGLLHQALPIAAAAFRPALARLKQMEAILAALAPAYDPETANDLFNGLLVLRLGRYRRQLGDYLQTALAADRSRRSLLLLTALTPSADDLARTAQSLVLSTREKHFLAAVAQRIPAFNRLASASQPPDRGQVYRFFARNGEAGIAAVLLGLADLRAYHGPALSQDDWAQALTAARILLENVWEKPEESVAPPRLLDGHTLMQAFNLAPGPLLAQILSALEAAQAEGRVLTRNDALVFVERWLDEKGNLL